MSGWEYSFEMTRLHIRQRQQEAERHRLVRIAKNGRPSTIESLAGTLGHYLIVAGLRLLPAASRPMPDGNAVALRQSAGPCDLAAGQRAIC